jgi:hypothetical protein
MVERKSPQEHAKDYAGRQRKGNDGHMWISSPDKNGRYRWVRVKASGDNKMKRQTNKKYTTRPSPPFSAQDFCGKRKKGNDGNWWVSTPDKNGRCRWVTTHKHMEAMTNWCKLNKNY